MFKTLLKIKQMCLVTTFVSVLSIACHLGIQCYRSLLASVQFQDLADLVVPQILLDTTGLHFTQ